MTKHPYPVMCSLTSEGVSVLLTGATTVLIQGIDQEDYWQVHGQLRAWDLGFSGDEDQLPSTKERL